MELYYNYHLNTIYWHLVPESGGYEIYTSMAEEGPYTLYFQTSNQEECSCPFDPGPGVYWAKGSKKTGGGLGNPLQIVLVSSLVES